MPDPNVPDQRGHDPVSTHTLQSLDPGRHVLAELVTDHLARLVLGSPTVGVTLLGTTAELRAILTTALDQLDRADARHRNEANLARQLDPGAPDGIEFADRECVECGGRGFLYVSDSLHADEVTDCGRCDGLGHYAVEVTR